MLGVTTRAVPFPPWLAFSLVTCSSSFSGHFLRGCPAQPPLQPTFPVTAAALGLTCVMSFPHPQTGSSCGQGPRLLCPVLYSSTSLLRWMNAWMSKSKSKLEHSGSDLWHRKWICFPDAAVVSTPFMQRPPGWGSPRLELPMLSRSLFFGVEQSVT